MLDTDEDAFHIKDKSVTAERDTVNIPCVDTFSRNLSEKNAV